MGARQFLQELYGDADRPATGKTRGGAREFMRSLPRSREDIYRNSTQSRDEIDGVAGVGFQFQRDLIRAAQRHSNGLGDVVRLALTAPEKVVGGVIGGVHGVLGGTDQMMADVLPENFGGRAYRQNAEANRHRAAEEQAAATRDLKTTLGRDVAGGLHSFGVTLPLTVGAMATKNPTLMYGGMGAQTGLTEYGTGRAAGLSPVHAAGYALNQGLIEAGTEKIPAGALVDAVKSNSPVASLVNAPLRYTLGEGLGEQVATHGQDWVSGAYIDAMHNLNWMQDYQNSRWDAARSTAVSSAVVGMGNAGAAASVHSAQQGLAQLRQQPATGRAGEFLGRLFGEQKTVAPAAAAQPAPAQQAAFVPPTVSQRDADALRAATELVRNIAAGGGMRTRQDVPTAAEAVGLGRPPAYRATANPGQVWHRGQNAVSGNAAITSTVNKIIGVESGGNANAKNPNSSATGLGQFISSTWLAMVRKYRPDVAAGKSEAQILALRTDPKLSREMTTRYVEENAAALRRAGQPVTEGNLYLAHFLGSGGALKLLGAADKSQPVVNLVGQGVINANSFLRGKSVQWVIDWTARKMGGRAAGGTATSPAQSAYAQGSETAEAPLYGNAEHTAADNRQDDAAAEMEQAAAAQREAAEEMQDAARRMGRETKVYLDQQMRTARLALMEADDLAPTMADAANQYRDRNRAASEMQINQIANRLQPELLGDSMQADTGAPTLANDGRTIIGGNGRVLGINRAYEQGGGEGYRQYLMDHAGQFGLSHEDVAAMRKPVLVRQLDESVDIAKAAVASNEGGGLGMSALEQARVDADRLPDFGTLHVGDDGNLNTAANRGFIRDFVQGMPTTVQAQMMYAGGSLSQEGLRRLHNAVLYRAYGNSPALSRMVESTDQGMRNMVNAMMQAAPKIAEAKEAIRGGHLHDADIAGDLVAAVEKLNQLRDGGQSVADYLAQQGLFGEDLSPVARDLLAFLEEHKRSAKAIATLLRNYYDALSAQGSPNQGDVFGDTAAPDKQQLLERTIDEYRQEHGKPSAGNDLFNDADGRAGIADRQAEPQSAGGRGDEAGAGEDAGGVGGQRESVSKDSGSLKFSRAVVEPVREAETFDEARAQAKAFQGKPLTNQDSGLVAVASRNSLDKMLSGKAVGKSVTPALHALAVANADKLYERAVYGWSKPDRSGDPNTVAIHRLFSVLDTEHGSYAVKLTVKETARSDQNNKLYTLEAVELNETSPAAQWVDSTVQADGLDPTSIRSVGDVKTLAQSTQHNKLYQGGADRVGFDTSAATHNRPTPTRSVEGAPDTNTTVRATPEEIKDLRQQVQRAVGEVRGKAGGKFSRSVSTQEKYEQRIDDLFSGAKANLHGAIVLDRSDLLDMLGYGDMPVQLDEAKVLLNQKNHPEMTADAWKRVPEWLDNPAAVLKSRTHDKRLVFVPEEMMNGAPVYVIVEPDTKGLRVHALVNAYAKDGNPAQAMRDIERDLRNGHVDYVNKEKARELLGRSGLQLPRLPSLNTSRSKILTEKNLQGYLKNKPALSLNHAGKTETVSPEHLAQLRQAVARAVGTANMRHIDLVSRADLVRPDNAEDLRGAEGWYDPKTRRITLIAEALPNARTAQFVAWHELGHRKMDVSGWQDWRQVLAQSRRNEVIGKLTQMIGRQRRQAGENITLDGATEEAAVELYAAMKNGDYEAIREKYGVTVPLAMREGLMGYFTRFARRLQEVLARAFGIKAQDFSDTQVFELLRGIDRAEENSANLPLRQQRAIEQGFMTEQQWEDLLNERIQPRRMDRRDGLAGHAGRAASEQGGVGAEADGSGIGGGTGRADAATTLRRFFHGTHADVSRFDLNHPGRKDHGWLGTGVYLTDNPDAAEAYAYAKGKRSEGGQNVMPLAIKLKNPYVADSRLKKEMQHADRKTADALTRRLQEMGHDGVILRLGPDAHEVVVFDPANVRSVHAQFDADKAGENGLLYSRKFSRGNPHLNKQKGRQFLKTHPLQLHWDITSDADLLKRNIKTNEDLAQDSGSLKFSRSADQSSYEQAKAAGETELTFKQWQQVRTPEFKAWFGDWENDPDNASKVVNPNTGEPLVVYHGTEEDFTVFDRKKGRENMDIQGMFFSPDHLDSSGYGSNVKSFFLNLKNPSPTTFMLQFQGQDRAGAKAYEYAVAQGYDGVMAEEDGYVAEYVAFHPNQIKSATDNSGAFDAGNDDIRYSRGNPLADGGRSWFNEMGELNAGLAAYNKLADVIRPALAKVKMANDHPQAFTRYMRDYRAQLNVAGETAKEVAKAGIKITEAERKLLSDVLERELPPGAEAAPELQELAAAMRAILNQQTDDLKALGMISPESAERFRDTYLPRFYNKQSGGLFDRSELGGLNREFRRTMRGSMGRAIGGQHLKGRGIFKEVNRGEQAKYEAQGFELRQDYGSQGDKAGKVLMWRDYTKVERQQMGEERDAILRFTNGYIKTQADIAKGILFQRIATDADLASKTEVEGWTQVPDTAIAGTGGVKRYGALAGMWVHPEVAYHLQQQFYIDNVAQRVWRELLGWWKLNKTVYNAVAHVNNVMSNMVMLFVAGGRMRDVVPAALSIKHKDALYREALEQGLVGEAVDVAGLQEMFVGLNNASDDGIIMNTLVGRLLKRADKYTGRVASRAGKAMQTAYRVEDEVFKLALYRRGRERGLSPREAADYALTFMFDYSEVPQGVKWLRDTGTLPFVSYTYKALPALARATLTRPHRMLAVTGLMYGINAVSYALLGGEADEEEEREYMPDYQKGHTIFGTPKLIRMPWNDSKGKPVFLDVYRWLPLGDFADTQNQMGGLPIPQWMMPNGPVIGHISALVNNKDTFSGRELVKDYMSAGEKATIYGKWLAAQWLPASVGVPLSYHSNNVLDGLKNQFEDTKFAEVLEAMGYTGTNYRGEDKQLSRALLGAVGVKLRGEKVEDLKAARQRRVGAEVREVQADIRRISRDNTLTDSTKDSRIQQRQAHLQKLFEQMPK